MNEWLEATDMSIIRSALTANVVKRLPNIRDYIHQERDKLAEERRLRLYGTESTESFGLEIDTESSFALPVIHLLHHNHEHDEDQQPADSDDEEL